MNNTTLLCGVQSHNLAFGAAAVADRDNEEWRQQATPRNKRRNPRRTKPVSLLHYFRRLHGWEMPTFSDGQG
jgi:hypothetical protein